MIRNLLTQTTKQLAIVASVIGAGAFTSAPAIAQYSSPSGNMNEMPAQTQQEPAGAMDMSNMTIVELASGNESFNTLTQAVQAAGLTDTLSGQGPYTVFAPTDEAFSQLPDGALEYLLQPENRDLLRQVLTYHVVPGEVTASEITSGPVEALGGGLAVRVAEDRIIVNNASVIQPNVQASNGVVHAVNRVLLPETLQQTLASQLGVAEIYQ